MSESRINNSLKNLKVAWIGQLVNMVCSFASRQLFIMNFSSEIIGLDAFFLSVVGMLNVAELGIGTAMNYALYKPLAEKDEQKVSALMVFYSRVYKMLAIIIFLLGVLLIPILSNISEELRSIDSAKFYYMFYVLNSSMSYLFQYWGIISSADQKNYMVLGNYYSFKIVQNFVNIFIFIYTGNYLIFLISNLFFTVSSGLRLRYLIQHSYSYLNQKINYVLPKEEKNDIVANVRKISISKIGKTLINATDNIVLTSLVSLKVTGIYSNYILIESYLYAISVQVMNAISASLGNIVANDEKEKIEEYFVRINFIVIAFYSICALLLYTLFNDFIELWVGKEYLFQDNIVKLIVGVYFVTGIRSIIQYFYTAFGSFKYENTKAILETSTNLIISVVLTYKYGVIGTISGTIISAVLIGLPFELMNLLYKFKFSLSLYFKEMFKMIFVFILSLVICTCINSFAFELSIFDFVLKAIVDSLIYILIFYLGFRKNESFLFFKELFIDYVSRKLDLKR